MHSTARGERKLPRGTHQKLVADAEDELALENVERLVEVVSVERRATRFSAMETTQRRRGGRERFPWQAQAAQAAWLDGAAGAVFTSDGRPRGAIAFVVSDDRITAVEIISKPASLAALDVTFST